MPIVRHTQARDGAVRWLFISGDNKHRRSLSLSAALREELNLGLQKKSGVGLLRWQMKVLAAKPDRLSLVLQAFTEPVHIG